MLVEKKGNALKYTKLFSLYFVLFSIAFAFILEMIKLDFGTSHRLIVLGLSCSITVRQFVKNEKRQLTKLEVRKFTSYFLLSTLIISMLSFAVAYFTDYDGSMNKVLTESPPGFISMLYLVLVIIYFILIRFILGLNYRVPHSSKATYKNK